MRVYHIPAAIMNRHKPFSDPREQDVEQTPESIADAYEANCAERAEAGVPLLPMPGITEPIYLHALRGDLPAGTCNACGQPTAYHLDTTGTYWVGCKGVPARLALKQLSKQPMTEVAEYGDLFPAVSAAVRDVLRTGCGEAVCAWFEHELSAEERINLSRRVARIAVVAYRAEQGK